MYLADFCLVVFLRVFFILAGGGGGGCGGGGGGGRVSCLFVIFW